MVWSTFVSITGEGKHVRWTDLRHTQASEEPTHISNLSDFIQGLYPKGLVYQVCI